MRVYTLARVLALFPSWLYRRSRPLLQPDLTISLSPASGTFQLTGATPDPGDCLSDYCVLFSGMLTDNDIDDSVMSAEPALFAAAQHRRMVR